MKLEHYPQYKDSGVEWVGKIPKDWEIKKLDYYSEIVPGHPFNSDLFSDEGIPLIRIRDLEKVETVIRWSGGIVEEALVEKNDILVGMDGDFDVVVWKGDKALLNQRILKINSKRQLKKEYLKYFLHFPMKQINEITMSTTVKHLSISDVKKAAFPFPKLEEQTLIVSFLDKKTSEIDLTIEKDTRLIELLKEKRTALINHVVTKGLDPTVKMKDSGVEWIGEIPEDWDIKKIKFASNVIMGQSPKSEDYNFEGIGEPFLQGNAEFGEISPNPVKYCNNANKFSEIGDILISVRAPVGETNISDQKYAIGRGLATIRTFDPLKSYLWYGIDVFKILFNYISSGSTYDAVSVDEVKSMQILIPSEQEQKEIAFFLDKKTSEIDLTIQKIQQNIELLEEYKKSLIHHVVTGKVDVREVAV